jgi:predicted enzyme related to lactoylglutathione lyase
VILFAGMPVSSIASAREWYERLFGRPPDLVPNEREVCWQTAEGGWIYVVEDPPRAGRSLVTLIVEDLDAAVAPAEERGLDVVRQPGGPPFKVELTDPDGNKVTFGRP